MRRTAWFTLLLTIGCGDSCEGCRQGEGSEAQPTKPVRPAIIARDGGVQGVTPPKLTPHHRPRAEGPELEALEAAKKKLEQRSVRDSLASTEQLADSLPDTLDGFAAKADATLGPSQALGRPIAGIKRVYTDGDRTAVVKVTDTGQAPGLLAPWIQRLTAEGSAPVGNERGVLVGDIPAVVSYYPEHKNSRIAAIIDGHLLVEIRMTGATDADAARQLFERLRF